MVYVQLVLGILLVGMGIFAIRTLSMRLIDLPLSLGVLIGGYIVIFRAMAHLFPQHHAGVIIVIGLGIIAVAVFYVLLLLERSKYFHAPPQENSQENSHEPIVHEHFGNMLSKGELGNEEFRP